MAERIRSFDWSQTSLGRPDDWPQSLKTALKIALNSRYPIWMGWGKELLNLYNDPYIPVLGKRDEWALGASAREVWKEVWVEHLGPQAEAVLLRGEASWNDQRQMIMHRNGYAEETYFTFSFSPLPADEGGIGGLFCTCTEETPKVLGERRLAALRQLATATALARTEEEASAIALRTLADHAGDVAFALIYLLTEGGESARLVSSMAESAEASWAPAVIVLTPGSVQTPQSGCWPLRRAMADGTQLLRHLPADLKLPGGRWSEPANAAAVLPLAKAGHERPRGFLVVGASPRLPFDDHYQTFFELLARSTADALSNARAYEEEKKRAEALAELDRAKTAFFNNVSHEFRTPLTLMLGPVEDLLAKSHTDLSDSAKGQLEVVNRNGLRLLRLVNSLLDFSRIEAGRVQALYEPTDLAAFTAEVASCFRSATERAGLQLQVDCSSLSEPIYVDHAMWEKIVLNLLSNAFKFTFDGSITVTFTQVAQSAELRVSDTGVGIPAEDLPRLFERFHRVENMRSRTFEGSGIGLALVYELVKLHGGSVRIESRLGEGSTFIVSLPLGMAHLPQAHIGHGRSLSSSAAGAAPCVEEALRWLPEDLQEDEPAAGDSLPYDVMPVPCPGQEDDQRLDRPSILVADDNADMRRYIVRLLSERYRVRAVGDGRSALDAVGEQRPDLIVSDVMMPNLDGFGLLRELRGNPLTATIPVILLSARAGEECRVEGLTHGADDYLIKPFTARELLARIDAHVNLAGIRRAAESEIARSKLFLERIAMATPDLLFVYDVIEGRNVYINRSIESVLGYSIEQLQSMPDDITAALVHPDDLPAVKAWHSRFDGAGEQILESEHRVRRADGTYCWVSARATVFEKTSDGRTQHIIGTASDISSRKAASEALHNSTAILRAVNESTDDLIAVKDLRGRYLLANPATLRVMGKTEADVLGRTDAECFANGRAAAQIMENDQAVMVTGRVHTVEESVWMEDGWHVFQSVKSPYRDDQEQVRGVIVMARDITQSKRTEEALRESEGRFRAAVGVVSSLIWTNNAEGRMEGEQPGWGKFTGQRYEEYQGYGWSKAVHPDDAQATIDAWNEAVANKSTFDFEHRVRRHDGEWRLCSIRAVPVLTEDGRLREWVGVHTDITERKQAEAAVLSRTAQFETLLNQAPLGVYLVDADFRITQVNPMARPVFDAIPDLIGRDLGEVMRRLWEPNYAEEVIRIFRHTLETGEPYITTECIEQRLDRKVSEYYEWRIDRIVLPDGRFGVVCYFRDIAAQVQARQALAENAEALQQLNAELESRVEERTSALVASESRLRGLATQLNLAEQRERDRLAGELHDYLAQLLVVGKITLGQAKRAGLPPTAETLIKETDETLSQALAYCRTLMAELSPPILQEKGLAVGLAWLAGYMKRHGLSVTVQTTGADDLPLPKDRAVLLFQSVRELLINVSKHAQVKEASVRMDCTDGLLRILVQDENGFDVVAAAAFADHSPLSSKFGLFSIRERMQALGGTFDIESAPGRGTTASLSLPLAPSRDTQRLKGEPSRAPIDAPSPSSAAAIPRPQVHQDDQRKIRVLLVDDHAVLRQGLRGIIAGYDHLEAVGEAVNGLEAVELTQLLQPDVVVMDINMPKMDGIEATKRIKSRWPQIIVIGLSVHGAQETADMMKAAGATAYLTKESAGDALCQVIESAMKKERKTVPSRSGS